MHRSCCVCLYWQDGNVPHQLHLRHCSCLCWQDGNRPRCTRKTYSNYHILTSKWCPNSLISGQMPLLGGYGEREAPFLFCLSEQAPCSLQGSSLDSKTVPSSKLSLWLYHQCHRPLQSEFTLFCKADTFSSSWLLGSFFVSVLFDVPLYLPHRSTTPLLLQQNLHCGFPTLPWECLSPLLKYYFPLPTADSPAAVLPSYNLPLCISWELCGLLVPHSTPRCRSPSPSPSPSSSFPPSSS